MGAVDRYIVFHKGCNKQGVDNWGLQCVLISGRKKTKTERKNCSAASPSGFPLAAVHNPQQICLFKYF